MGGSIRLAMVVKARPISVLVVDDHRTFAEALAVAIGLERDLSARVAWSGLEALQMVQRDRPDVILIDLQMPGLSGIETIRRIRELHSNAAVLVISAHDDDLSKARSIEAGARGFVSKLTPLSEVPALIRRTRSGKPLLEPEETDRLLRLLRHRRHQLATERQRANRLTPRQVQILQLLSDGVPMAKISERLSMTSATLRTHVQNILTRLGVHTKVEAVAIAIRNGKISGG
jgi:DNA-binding NarL/FixJ family response regulator